jgi:hypothetical protein
MRNTYKILVGKQKTKNSTKRKDNIKINLLDNCENMDWIVSTNLLANFVFVHNDLLNTLIRRNIKLDLLSLVQEFKSEKLKGGYDRDNLRVDGKIILNKI